jgi:hypothetical protein
MSNNLVVKDMCELYYYVIISKQYKLCFFRELAINVKDCVV